MGAPSGAVRTSSVYAEVVDEFWIQNSHEFKRELGLKYSGAPGLAADSEIVCASVRCESKDFDALVDAGNIMASNMTRVLFLTKGVAVSAAKRVLIVALVLLVSGAGAIGISLIPPSGPGPKYECVTDEPVSSGFSDPNQGDCPITIESHRARTRWENRGARHRRSDCRRDCESGSVEEGRSAGDVGAETGAVVCARRLLERIACAGD